MLSTLIARMHSDAVGHLRNFMAEVEKGEEPLKQLQSASELMHANIFMEETVIFERVRNSSNSMRIRGLEVEHGGIWKLFEKIGEYVKNNEIDLALDRADGLIRVINTHHSTEENLIFQDLNKIGVDEQAGMIQRHLVLCGIPNDWLCSILRKSKR